jgi:hypothetical protein
MNTPCPNDRIDLSNERNSTAVFLFVGCTWMNPKTKGNGGAICLINYRPDVHQQLSVIHCDLSMIDIQSSHSRGGAFDIYGVDTVNVSISTFSNLSSETTSGIRCFMVSKCILIHNCQFVDCYCVDGFGCVNVNGLKIPSDKDCVNVWLCGIMFGCLIRDCRTKGRESGGICFTHPPHGS